MSLQANVDMARYSARELRDVVRMRRILHIRPYADSSYAVIVLYTNEPDIVDPDDGRRSRNGGGGGGGGGDAGITGGVYDYSFGFMIYDVAAGVVCQIIDNFVPPQTPIDALLFTNDVSLCVDHESNVFSMATGYYKKRLHNKDVRPRLLALHDRVVVYFDRCFLYALRLCDGVCIGHVNVHASIATVALCPDARTLVIGCRDGSLLSYVIIDESSENASNVLRRVYSRQSPLVAVAAGGDQHQTPRLGSAGGGVGGASTRSWDKVDFASAVNGPPYSRPPSAIISGPRDRDLLRKVTPVSRPKSCIGRDRPRSDTVLYRSAHYSSRACVVM